MRPGCDQTCWICSSHANFKLNTLRTVRLFLYEGYLGYRWLLDHINCLALRHSCFQYFYHSPRWHAAWKRNLYGKKVERNLTSLFPYCLLQGSIHGKSEVKVEKGHLVAELKLKMINMRKATFSISTLSPRGCFF